MAILDFLGKMADKMSEAQVNSSFFLIRTPLFKQFLDICFNNYPDPLDLYAWSYEIVPIYFIAGALDFGIMTLGMALYSQFALIFLPVGSNGAGTLLSELQSPRSRVFRGLILISFALRGWKLGLGNIQRTCKIRRALVQWSEMRKLVILILILCPALFWHCLSEVIFGWIKIEKPWMSQIFWVLLSGDWETATLRSGFLLSKGKGVLARERDAKLNETWTAFNLRVLKMTAIQVPLEMFLRNFAYIAVALILAVGRNAPLILSVIASLLKRLSGLVIFVKLAEVDKAASEERDRLLMFAVRYFHKGSVSWRQSEFPKYLAYLGRLFDMYAQPSIWKATLYTGSIFNSTILKIKSAIVNSKVGRGLRLGGDRSIFRPVPSRRFRLLEVEPSLSYDQDIRCTLALHHLSSAPQYTAISYVWNSSQLTSTIILNGKQTKSTASAHAALKGLRSRWRKKQFWIDAICIDQNSDVDKGEQISIMADIYRNAKQVTIWLGPEANGSLAFSLVKRLFIRTRLSDKMGSLASGYSLNAPSAAWNAFQKLLRNPWFHRCWVVQEVMSRNVIVQYGDAKIDWTLLSQFAMAVENDTQTMDKIYALTGNDGHWASQWSSLNLQYIRIMEEFRSMQPRQLYGLNIVSYTEDHLSLLFYLTRMFRSNCRFQATNTQDRIYALLNLSGLASDAEFNNLLSNANLLGNKTPQNTPDYFDRLAEFFTIVATHFLTSGLESRRLDFIFHAGTTHRSRLPGLPSWVPDWSLEPMSNPLLAYDGSLELLQHPRLKGVLEAIADWQSIDEISFSGRPKQQEALKRLQAMSETMISTKSSPVYRATKTTNSRFTLHRQERILELSGGIIDCLHSVGEPFPGLQLDAGRNKDPASKADRLTAITSTIIKWFALSQTALFLSHPAPNDRETQLAHHRRFERTLLADVSHPAFDFALPSSPVRPVPEEKVGVAAIMMGIANGKIPLARLQDDGIAQILMEWTSHIGVTCKGRCFGVTGGGLMGLFPVGSKAGDGVCLVEGAGVPFVVREIGEENNVLGASGDMENSKRDVEEETGDTGKKEWRMLYELVGPAYVHGIMDGEAMEGRSGISSILMK